MSLPLIAILGKAGAGKSTLAEEMISQHGGICVSWADPLKQLCIELTDMPAYNAFGPSEAREVVLDIKFPDVKESLARLKESFTFAKLGLPVGPASAALASWVQDCHNFIATKGGITARFALQRLGTEWGRGLDPEVWVRTGINTGLQYLEDGIDAVYYPDTRFANEVIAVKKTGGVVLGIVGVETTAGGHDSEKGIKAVPAHFLDAVFDNSARHKSCLTRWVENSPVVRDTFKQQQGSRCCRTE